jgi:hypothetical protein
VSELPLIIIEVVVQVRIPPVAITPGTDIFCETVTVSFELHPFAGSVAVSI